MNEQTFMLRHYSILKLNLILIFVSLFFFKQKRNTKINLFQNLNQENVNAIEMSIL
jgi:hypothetical protein